MNTQKSLIIALSPPGIGKHRQEFRAYTDTQACVRSPLGNKSGKVIMPIQNVECDRCLGDGQVEMQYFEICPKCKGDGRLNVEVIGQSLPDS